MLPPVSHFAQLLFPDFSLILLGWLLCRHTPLDRKIWEPVESLVYYLLFPVLLFQSIVRSPLDPAAASGFVGAGLLLTASGIALAYALPRLPGLARHIDGREFAGAAQVGFRFNSFIALALCDRLLGAPGLAALALLIGFCVPLANIGAVWPMARHGGRRFGAALLRNPLILATGSGLVANLLGFSVPQWLAPTLDRIGASSVALGLMAAGAGMQLRRLNEAKVLGAGVLAIRHLLLPLLAFALARTLQLGATQSTVLLLFAAVPTASSCYVLASRMGFNGPFVAGLVTLSTLLGMASLPFALGVLGAGLNP